MLGQMVLSAVAEQDAAERRTKHRQALQKGRIAHGDALVGVVRRPALERGAREVPDRYVVGYALQERAGVGLVGECPAAELEGHRESDLARPAHGRLGVPGEFGPVEGHAHLGQQPACGPVGQQLRRSLSRGAARADSTLIAGT